MKRIKTLLALIILTSSLQALAFPAGFVDLGSSTIDKNTGLEWLDLSFTESYSGEAPSKLYLELQAGIGLGADGWRIANTDEYISLVKRFVGIELDYFQEQCFGLQLGCIQTDIEPIASIFMETFYGYPEISSAQGVWFGGSVIHNETNWMTQFLNNQIEWVGGFALDLGGPNNETDLAYIRDSGWSSNTYELGSFLVREVKVNEPGLLAIMFISILGLMAIRRKT